MVKSPYNFVPAPSEGEVFTPDSLDWADLVSHDVPFEDGESGEIAVKITAETPIFVRNGHAEGKETNEFSHVGEGENRKYFIPATSIKGMLRNVLEIMSFSRMKQVADDRYAFRDLTKNSLYMKSYRSQEVKAGWLNQLPNGGWQIEECESMAFISHIELAKEPFNMGFRANFLNKDPGNNKSAQYKYNSIGKTNLVYSFKVKLDKNNYNKPIAEYDSIGVQGTLVFTGQSSKRNENRNPYSGKINEFVFFDDPNPSFIQVSEKQVKDFKFIYLDHDKDNISIDWKFWKNKLEHGQRVPIFYSKDSQGNLKHFGLAFMYKLPFQYSIHEVNPITKYNKTDVDLAELIFGYSKGKQSLKGRVIISHAFSENVVPLELRREILGSPKASYYPFYLNQFKKTHPDGKKDYNTYQDKEASLRGYKRYPVQRSIPTEPFEARYSKEQRNNPDVFSSFIPLKEGAEFTFKIRFHNLRKAEIGALISSLTFHGENHKYFHSLGAAKPFGYGKLKVVSVDLKNLKFENNDYLKSFEDVIGEEKIISEPIRKLFAMASTSENLSYPKLEQFVSIKNNEGTIWEYDTSQINMTSVTQKLQKETKRKELSIEYDLDNILSFKELRNRIKADFDDEVPDANKSAIYECIKRIFNEKETKKTFKEKKFLENPWQLPISIWLGPERAKNLYEQLTKP